MNRRWTQLIAVLMIGILAGVEAAEARRRHRDRQEAAPPNGHASRQLVRAHRDHVRDVVNRYLESHRLTPEQEFWAQVGLDKFMQDNRDELVPVNLVDWTGDASSLEPDGSLEALVPLPSSELSPTFRPILPAGGIVCLPGDELLLNGRFVLAATFQDFSNVIRRALTCRMTPAAGYFFFFDRGNVEIPVKMLNACFGGNPPTHWVFLSGLTNFGVSITVFDLFTGISRTYTTNLGQTFPPVIDQQTPFPCP